MSRGARVVETWITVMPALVSTMHVGSFPPHQCSQDFGDLEDGEIDVHKSRDLKRGRYKEYRMRSRGPRMGRGGLTYSVTNVPLGNGNALFTIYHSGIQ